MKVRICQSTNIERSTVDSMHPCLTPVAIQNGYVSWILCVGFHGTVESSRATVCIGRQKPFQNRRTTSSKRRTIHVTVQGSGASSHLYLSSHTLFYPLSLMPLIISLFFYLLSCRSLIQTLHHGVQCLFLHMFHHFCFSSCVR